MKISTRVEAFELWEEWNMEKLVGQNIREMKRFYNNRGRKTIRDRQRKRRGDTLPSTIFGKNEDKNVGQDNERKTSADAAKLDDGYRRLK